MTRRGSTSGFRPGSVFVYAAALLLLLCPANGAAQQSQARIAPARRTVPTDQRAAGRVLSARDGHGIQHATVSLSPVRSGVAREPAATVTTDAEGRFRFEALPSGKYHLQASANGYTPSAYQEHENFSTAIVLGAGFATDTLTMELTPAAIIQGHVRDGYGDPVPNAQMILYRENTSGEGERVLRVRNTQSDEDGRYEFPDLPPGRYYAAVTARPWYAMHPHTEGENSGQSYRSNIDPALDVAYPMVFYPHAASDAEAVPITLRGGEQLPANFSLQPVHAVTLTFPASRTQNGQPSVIPPQLMHRAFGTVGQFVMTEGFTDNDGFHLTGVAPGQYSLLQMRPGGSRFAAPEQQVTVGSAPLTLNMPAVQGTAKVMITARSETGEGLLKRVQVNLRSLTGEGAAGQPLNDKGVTEFTDVPAGDYRIQIFGSGRPQQVVAMTVGGQPVPDRTLHVNGSGDLMVQISLQGAAHVVEGVALREGKPLGGAMVMLVPAGADTGADLFRRDQSDMDGSFTLNNVAPGNYLVLAVEDAWKMRWTDLATLTPYLVHAVPLTVRGDTSAKVQMTEGVPVQTRDQAATHR